jgi:hypothetical protein
MMRKNRSIKASGTACLPLNPNASDTLIPSDYSISRHARYRLQPSELRSVERPCGGIRGFRNEIVVFGIFRYTSALDQIQKGTSFFFSDYGRVSP